MFQKRVDISRLSSSIDPLTREERSEQGQALLERIGAAKVEALRRIEALPWYALDRDDWHRDVEGVTPTADDASQALAEILARVKRCRMAADPTPVEAAAEQPGPPKGFGFRQQVSVPAIRKAALRNEVQQAQLTLTLLLIEIQLDKLIDLIRDSQSA